MRVFMTADAVGGVWTYALDLAGGLVERGDEVTLAVLGPPPSSGQADAAVAAGVRLLETGLPLDWTAEHPSQLRQAADTLARLASHAHAQVVHLNSPALAAAGYPAPVVGVAHSCLKTWWCAMRTGELPADFRWRVEATAEGYGACETLIAPSAAFATATEAAYGVTPLVILNGRAPMDEAEAAVREIAVATAGRLWDEGKGAATLDAAAARLKVPLLAFGPTSGPRGQELAAAHLDAQGAVAGDVLGRTLERTRVFASAAFYEPFGLTVLEAAQRGCALVLSDIATFRELWEGCAVFVAPGDVDGFAEAITDLLADDIRCEQLSAAARIRADRYDLASVVESTAAIHRAVSSPAVRAEAAA